jgi:hypothetical protein
MRRSEPKPHQINKLLLAFESEFREMGMPQNGAGFGMGTWAIDRSAGRAPTSPPQSPDGLDEPEFPDSWRASRRKHHQTRRRQAHHGQGFNVQKSSYEKSLSR